MFLFTRLSALVLSVLSLSACNVPSLENTHWLLQSMDGRAVVAHSEITLAFLSEGLVTGSASCNRYFGQFTHVKSKIRLNMSGVTKMWCHSEHGDVMAQESRFLKALSSTDRLSWSADKLVIHLTDSAEPLRLMAVKP